MENNQKKMIGIKQSYFNRNFSWTLFISVLMFAVIYSCVVRMDLWMEMKPQILLSLMSLLRLHQIVNWQWINLFHMQTH